MVNSRIASALKIAAIGYAVYLAAVLLVVTPLLNLLAPKLYRDQTGTELRIDNILVNPFTLRVVALHGAGANADGSPFWSFDTAIVDLALSSIWRGYPALDEVRLDGVSVQIDQTAPDRFNFTSMAEHAAARSAPQPVPAPETNSGGLPRLSIAKFGFNARHLGLSAPHMAEPFASELRDIAIAIADFNTLPPPDAVADATLPTIGIGAFDAGVARFSLESLRKDDPFATHLDTLHIALKNFSTVVAAGQPYEVNVQDEAGGRLRWQGDLSLAEGHSAGVLELNNISLLPVWRFFAPRLAFTAQSALLDVGGRYQLDWKKTLRYRIDAGRVALRQLQLQARNDADTGLAFGTLSADGIAVDSTAQKVAAANVVLDGLALRGWNKDTQVSLVDMFKLPPTAAAEETPAQTPPWQVQVAALQVRNSRVDWRASQLDVPALAVTPLELRVTNLHWPEAAPAGIELNTAINESFVVAVTGNLVPTTLTGALSGDVRGLPLSWGNTLLGTELSAMLNGGTLASRWQVQLEEGKPVSAQADGEIDGFELLRLPDRRRLLAWRQLQWQKLALDLRAQSLQLARINLTEPWVQFRINADGTTNFQRLVIAGDDAAASAAQPQPPAAPAPAADGKPWRIEIATLAQQNGTLDFRDNSLPYPFRAKIGNFTGTVTGLSADPKRSARVDLKGSVDGYAPVTLTGTASPLADPPAIDLALDFANIDLATLTPYSGTYAGYAIDRGQLSVQLAYKLEDGRIKGSNRVIVQQLKLGQQMRSAKMIDLPLRLAIALLTDANGVMDLGVDISGNLDDPQFDLSGIIWKAFRNLIVKAVTAPFRLLGSLLGGDAASERLGEVDFAPGSEELSADSQAKLTKLKDALLQRPALRLSVAGHTDPAQDGPALQQRQLNFRLFESGLDRAAIEARGKPWQKKIESLYEKQFPDRDTDDKTPDQLATELRDAMVLKPTDLDTLAGQRALAVKRVLVVDLGLGADRVFIDSDSGGKNKEAAAQVKMSVEG